MNVTGAPLSGLVIVQPKAFDDTRGFFLETWNAATYARAGIDVNFVQDNLSRSCRGTIRGLHFQSPGAQGKLVYVLDGEVWDVVVDVRGNSPTFGQWYAITLSAHNKVQMYVPPGFAHGFCVTSEVALFAYKCTALYRAECEHVIRWDDSELAIPWPARDAVISDKDRSGICLRALPSHLFDSITEK